MAVELNVNPTVEERFGAHLGMSDPKTGQLIDTESVSQDNKQPEDEREELVAETEETEEAAEEKLDASDEPAAESDEGQDDEYLETWADLAETFEVEPDELLAHIQIAGREGDGADTVSLKTIVDHYRAAPEANAQALTQLEQERTTEREAHDARIDELQRATLSMMSRVDAENHTDEWWNNLREKDPAQYISRREQQARDQRSIDSAFETMNAEKQRRATEDQAQADAYQSEQATLLFQIQPKWRDPKIGKAVHADVETYMKQFFSQQQLDELVDARSIEAVWKARQYDKSQERSPGLKKRLRKVSRKRLVKTARDERQAISAQEKAYRASSARLKETGRLEDGLDAFGRHI